MSGGPTEDAAVDPLLGRRLGAYVVRARLGAGAIGGVYRAEDTRDGTAVALKVLLPELARNTHAVKRLEREAAFVQRLRHPHVVRVHEVGSDAGTTYVAMELIAGRTLEEALAREGALGLARAVQLGLDIASALAEAHRHGVVHRDLKPANVMLAREGGEERAKLVDFGVARLLDDDGSAPLTRLTREGFTVGTPAYMSPEQLGSAAVGPEADLYALGLILHEVVRGVPAFGGGLREVVLKQLTEDPPPLPEHHGLGRLVAALTAKEPQRRPASAEVVRAELEAIAARAAGPATPRREPPTTDTQLLVATLAPPGRPRRAGVVLALACVVVGAAALALRIAELRTLAADSPAVVAPLSTEAPGDLASGDLASGDRAEGDPGLAPDPDPSSVPALASDGAGAEAGVDAFRAPTTSSVVAGTPRARPPVVARAAPPRRRGDPCRTGAASHVGVQRCLDHLDARLRPKALPPEHVLWTRYRDTWDQVALASTPADYARLLAALRVLARDVDRVP